MCSTRHAKLSHPPFFQEVTSRQTSNIAADELKKKNANFRVNELTRYVLKLIVHPYIYIRNVILKL